MAQDNRDEVLLNMRKQIERDTEIKYKTQLKVEQNEINLLSLYRKK